MKKLRQYFFILLLGSIALLLGYNYFYRPFEIPSSNSAESNRGSTQDTILQNTPEYILSQLSDREKVSQLIAAPVVVTEYFAEEKVATDEAAERVEASEETNMGEAADTAEPKDIRTGFYTLFGSEVARFQAQEVIMDLKKKNTVATLIPKVAVDHEGGAVQRLSGDGFTKLASWKEICSLETLDRQADLKRSANELRQIGIDVVLGPVLDVGNNAILKDRVCSTTEYAIVADRSMDYVTIFTNVGIMPVLKHFPGIGQTKKDLHTSFDSVSVLENDVKLYKYILDQSEKTAVMVAHVGVTSQDTQVPCSLSQYCVGELHAAYPNILIFTDALEMEAALYDKENPRVPKNLQQVSKEAVLAGNNVLVYGQSVTQQELSEIIDTLVIEYQSNPLFKPLIDQSVLKIIQYKTL